MTMGTRTYCYLDGDKVLANDLCETGGSLNGPLIAIREKMLMEPTAMDSAMNSNECDDDSVLPVCEYGVVLIDAARAEVTIGQFADDVLRSRMTTLLTAYTPSEVRRPQ